MYYDGFTDDSDLRSDELTPDAVIASLIPVATDAGLNVLLSAERYLRRGEVYQAKYSLHTAERYTR